MFYYLEMVVLTEIYMYVCNQYFRNFYYFLSTVCECVCRVLIVARLRNS